jgi:hypothetical protein
MVFFRWSRPKLLILFRKFTLAAPIQRKFKDLLEMFVCFEPFRWFGVHVKKYN